MIMGDGEEFECITQTSALQNKKNYQGGLNDTSNATVMWLISSVHSVKTGLETVSSLTTSIAAVKKGKKRTGKGNTVHTEGNLGTQDWAIVSGELETTA